jgi:hypothetical protein
MVASLQYVEKVVANCDKAAQANRRMPGRRGSTVVLMPDLADEILITGDMHGHRRNFNRIRRIAALDEHPRRHLVLQEICHGGPSYPDNGGCMSHTILEDAAELVARYPQQVHLILGNHELAELTDFPIRKNNQLLNLLFRLGLRQMYGSAENAIREAMIRFLWTCPLAVKLSQGVLVTHSLPEGADFRGFDPAVLLRDLVADDGLEGHDVFRLVWGRDYRRENAQAFCNLVEANVLITGHEPCREGFVAPNDLQVILDSCSEKAAYALLPVGVELSHADVMQRVEMLDV